jgi:hypothetical protein
MENQVMVYNGVEYELGSLGNGARECVTQLQDLQIKLQKSRLELEQLTVAYNYFNTLLGQELKQAEGSSVESSSVEEA